MSQSVFESEPIKLNRVDENLVVLSFLSPKRRGTTAVQISRTLEKLSKSVDWTEHLKNGVQSKSIRKDGNAYTITKKGHGKLTSQFGKDLSNVAWEKIREVYLPLLALGLTKDHMAGFIGRGAAAKFEAQVLNLAYSIKFPLSSVSLPKIRTALLWKLVKERFPEFDIKLSGNEQPISDQFSKKLLCLAAGINQGNVQRATMKLACNALGVDGPANIKTLRRIILERGFPQEERSLQPSSSLDLERFSQRVQKLANELSIPPFSQKVSIAEIYDHYGMHHSDAGGIAEFKTRLLKSFQKGLLNLVRSDSPRMVDPQIRKRSEITASESKLHFVVKS